VYPKKKKNTTTAVGAQLHFIRIQNFVLLKTDSEPSSE